MKRSKMKHNEIEWSRVECNIGLTLLFGYFNDNVTFHCIQQNRMK